MESCFCDEKSMIYFQSMHEFSWLRISRWKNIENRKLNSLGSICFGCVEEYKKLSWCFCRVWLNLRTEILDILSMKSREREWMNEIAETKLSAIVFCGKLEEAQAKRVETKLKK
jgi:hypothetical protein